ncbi:Chitin elicitor receptor kinase 1 [Varanus komodoensis]|nr:Chitin elicitor receptor kinase 1 [Varanus komodoensis]
MIACHIYASTGLGLHISNYDVMMGRYQAFLWQKMETLAAFLLDQQRELARVFLTKRLQLSKQQIATVCHHIDCDSRALVSAVAICRHAWLQEVNLLQETRSHVKSMLFDRGGLFHSQTDEHLDTLQKSFSSVPSRRLSSQRYHLDWLRHHRCDDGSKPNDNKQMDQKTFEIVDEEDASFILSVTQKLTNSLVAYREKKVSKPNSNERVDQSEPSMTTFVKGGESTMGKRLWSKVGFSRKHHLSQHSCVDKRTNLNIKPPCKRKASQLNADDSAKSQKLGTFVSTSQEEPNKAVFSDVAMHYPASEYCLPNPTTEKNSSSQNQPHSPSTSLSGPLISESDVISKFFSSIRNMDVDEVSATLHKIAASNPSFSGIDVQNVIKILSESGTLKSKKMASPI